MKRDTALLVGAGFSYPCGIPVMKDLAEEFPEILSKDERIHYERLKSLIPEITEDFEELMESCHDLKEAPVRLVNLLSKQCYGESFHDFEILVQGAKDLNNRLKEFLRRKCQIKKEKITYLYPLMNWLKKTGHHLDIFTLNYDLLVETLCEEFLITYTDGFLVNWHPELFAKKEHQVNLYKLHGSFIWYQSEWGKRVKIPILEWRNSVEYMAQDEVVSMMVYPRREKREPFEELLRHFRERLLTLEELIVIGYSFRDDELRKMVEDGLAKNNTLKLTIVSPDAESIASMFAVGERVSAFSGGVEDWLKANF